MQFARELLALMPEAVQRQQGLVRQVLVLEPLVLVRQVLVLALVQLRAARALVRAALGGAFDLV